MAITGAPKIGIQFEAPKNRIKKKKKKFILKLKAPQLPISLHFKSNLCRGLKSNFFRLFLA